MIKSKDTGLGVRVNTEKEFNVIKKFLGEDLLYVNWVSQMAEVPTSVIIYFSDDSFFSIGSVGSVEYQSKFGVRVVEFKDFFKDSNDTSGNHIEKGTNYLLSVHFSDMRLFEPGEVADLEYNKYSKIEDAHVLYYGPDAEVACELLDDYLDYGYVPDEESEFIFNKLKEKI